MRSERNLSIELLRGICCFLVVGIHIAPMYDLYVKMNITRMEMVSALLVQSIVRVGLPVFFIISGMFLLNRPVLNIPLFYRKRIPSVIIPFLVFSLIHFSIFNYSLFPQENYVPVGEYLNGLLRSTGISVHFWFVYAMIGIYLITPLINYFFNGITTRQAIISLSIILLIKFYNIYLKGYVAGLDIPDINTWLAYFMIGGLIPRLPKISRHASVFAVLTGYALTVGATYLQFNSGGTFFYAPFDAGINMYIFATALAYLFYISNINSLGNGARTINIVSENSYGIYLIHLIIAMGLTKYFDFSWYVGNSFYYTVMMTSIVFVLSLGFSIAINKTLVNPILKLIK